MQSAPTTSVTFSSRLTAASIDQFLSMHGVTVVRSGHDTVASIDFAYAYGVWTSMTAWGWGTLEGFLPTYKNGLHYYDIPFATTGESRGVLLRIPFAVTPLTDPSSSIAGSISIAGAVQYSNACDISVEITADDGSVQTSPYIGNPDPNNVYGVGFIPAEQINSVTSGEWPEPQEYLFGAYSYTTGAVQQSAGGEVIGANEAVVTAGGCAVRVGGLNVTSGGVVKSTSNQTAVAVYSNGTLSAWIAGPTLPPASSTQPTTTIAPVSIAYEPNNNVVILAGQGTQSTTSAPVSSTYINPTITLYPTQSFSLRLASSSGFTAPGTVSVSTSNNTTILVSYTGLGPGALTGCTTSYAYSFTIPTGAIVTQVNPSNLVYTASVQQNGALGAWNAESTLPVLLTNCYTAIVNVNDVPYIIVFNAADGVTAYVSQVTPGGFSWSAVTTPGFPVGTSISTTGVLDQPVATSAIAQGVSTSDDGPDANVIILDTYGNPHTSTVAYSATTSTLTFTPFTPTTYFTSAFYSSQYAIGFIGNSILYTSAQLHHPQTNFCIAFDDTGSNFTTSVFTQTGFISGAAPSYCWSFINNDGTYSVFGYAYSASVARVLVSFTAYPMNWLNVPIALNSALPNTPSSIATGGTFSSTVSTTVYVTSTEGFSSSGGIFTLQDGIYGAITISYTSATSTAFLGCTQYNYSGTYNVTPNSPVTQATLGGTNNIYHLVISAPESNHSSGVNFPVVKMNIPSMQSSPDGVTWIKYTSAAIPFQLQTIGSGQYTSATGNVTCLVEPGYNPATLYVPKSESTQQSDARVSYMFYGNLDHSATQRLLAYGSYTNNQRSFFTLGYDPVTCVMTTTTEVDGTLTTESATV